MDKDHTMEHRTYGMHVTDDAKILLQNHQKEKIEIKEKQRLEKELLEGNVITNRITRFNVGSSLLIAIIILIIQIRSCSRDEKKERQDQQQATRDSLKQVQQLRRDSLYEKAFLRIATEVSSFSKNDSIK